MQSPDTDSYTSSVNAAAKVFFQYWDFIHAIIRYKVRDKTQVDDLFQDFFLSLVFRPPPTNIQNMKGYLYKAITNDIADSVRRVERYQTQLRKYAECLNYCRTKDNPENALIKAEEMDKMFKLIERRLPSIKAQTILLWYRNNYKTKDIAKKMGISNTTTWRYIYKGLKEIRKFLKIR